MVHSNSLTKEVAYYKQEVLENETKLQEMKDQNKNPHDIKKFEEVLGESKMMIPDSKKRLDQALSDLEAFSSSTDAHGLETSEWYGPAQELLKAKNNQTQGESTADDVVEETDVSGLREGEAF